MKKEYVFTLILAILCFLEGNYYSTYNHKEQTLFVYKGTATERENTDLFQGLNYSDSAKSGNIESIFEKSIIPDAEQHAKLQFPLLKQCMENNN